MIVAPVKWKHIIFIDNNKKNNALNCFADVNLSVIAMKNDEFKRFL